MMIGIISDTHGLLRPEACERLAGVDHIIHAGDIGRPEVIAGLRELAPTTAIRGNIDRVDTDKGRWARGYPHTARLALGGRSIHVLHDLNDLDLDPAAAGIDVVVSGHSHRPKIETVGGVLYLNPGSAGPRRFSLPIALATLELAGDALRPRLHHLGGPPLPPRTVVQQVSKTLDHRSRSARCLRAQSPKAKGSPPAPRQRPR